MKPGVKHAQEKAVQTASASSKQKRTGRFVRNVLLTTGIIIAGAKIGGDLLSQEKKVMDSDKSKAKTPLLAENKGEAPTKQVRIPVPKEQQVTYENGIKIVGEKSFDVAIKDGIPYVDGRKCIDDASVGNEYTGNSLDFLTYMEKNEKLQYIQYSNFGTDKTIAYRVYESGIFGVSKDLNGNIQVRGVAATDGSKMFMREGAIYIAPNGSIVATTPTTLLLITPNLVKKFVYKTFDGAPDLTQPVFGRGPEDNIVNLTDNALSDSKGQLMYQIRMEPFRITIENYQSPLIGAR